MPQILTQNSAGFFKVNKWLSTCLNLVNFQSPWVIVFNCLVQFTFVWGERIWWYLWNHWKSLLSILSRLGFDFTHIQCLLLFDGFWQKTQNSWIRKKVLLLVTQQATLLSVYLQWFLLLRSPLGETWGPSRCYTCSGSGSHLSLRNSPLLTASRKLACFLWRATVPHISWLPTVNATLRNGSGKW